MNKESCTLKLVDEIILYYDVRWKKHQKKLSVLLPTEFVMDDAADRCFSLTSGTSVDRVHISASLSLSFRRRNFLLNFSTPVFKM